MTRFLIAFLVLTINVLSLQAQTVDVAPTGKQNHLPVMGRSIVMRNDSTTSLDSLIARLNGDWQFNETGKMYWIGYTDDMFSIAARGDTIITPLVKLIEKDIDGKGATGAIYTLHLLGIERQIAGRFYEQFVNPKARHALLYLLKYPDLQPTIMELLMRNPWTSDIPSIFETMSNCNTDCWALVNGLMSYGIKDPPIGQIIPDSIKNLSIQLKYIDENTLGLDFDFDGRLKEALDSIKRLGSNLISIEDALFKTDITGYARYNIKNSMSIGEFIYQITDIGYVDLGNKIQYYIENGKLYICSEKTAKQRWINWWLRQTADQRNIYKQSVSIHPPPFSQHMFNFNQ